MIQSVYIKNYGASAPAASGWYRPIEWLSQPTIADENVVWELMAVYVGDQNPYTNDLQASGGVTTEFYTDKDSLTPFYTATANNNTLIDYNDCDPSTEFRGYRQCWVKSFPTNPANNWSKVDFVQAHSVYGNYSSQICERLISCKTTHPSILSNHRMGGNSSISNMLENIEYRNKMAFRYLFNCYYYTPILKRIYFENPTVIEGAGSDCANVFTSSGLQTFPNNLTLKSVGAYQCFYASNLGECRYDFANTITQSYQTFYSTKANRIIGANMGNVTQNVGDFTNNNLYYLELQGYTIGHALNGNAMRGEEVFTAWVDSLGNASGAQNITVSTLQETSYGGIGSYVDNEIFNKGYTLIVV